MGEKDENGLRAFNCFAAAAAAAAAMAVLYVAFLIEMLVINSATRRMGGDGLLMMAW